MTDCAPSGDYTRRTKYRILILIAILSSVIAFMLFGARPQTYTHPHFVTESYIPPVGCESRSYRLYDHIAQECADRRYIFDDWRKYGLETPGRMDFRDGRWTGTYYRIGPDLIGISCIYKLGFCEVLGVERNVFSTRVILGA